VVPLNPLNLSTDPGLCVPQRSAVDRKLGGNLLITPATFQPEAPYLRFLAHQFILDLADELSGVALTRQRLIGIATVQIFQTVHVYALTIRPISIRQIITILPPTMCFNSHSVGSPINKPDRAGVFITIVLCQPTVEPLYGLDRQVLAVPKVRKPARVIR